MKLILSTLVLALLCGFTPGCVPSNQLWTKSYNDYKKAGKSWVETPISQVIESWGKPTTITAKDNGLTDYEWYWWGTHELVDRKKTKTHVVRCVTRMRVDGRGLVVKFITDANPFDREAENERCDLRPPLPANPGTSGI